MSKAEAWMPLYIGDYLGDTMHLDGPCHGAYLLLLMHSWRNGPLPADERKLAAIARTDLTAWRKGIGATVMEFFTATDAGFVQGRLERERGEAEKHSERRTASAKKAAASRWKGDASSMRDACATHAPGMPNAMPDECPPPSPLREELPPSPPSVVRSPQAKGTRLPADWQPEAESVQFAAALNLDPDRTAAQFRDYWHAKPGKDAVKLDWPATWRGWCRREAERRPSRPIAPAKPRESNLAWMSGMFTGQRDETPAPRFDIDGHAEEFVQ